MNVRVRESLRVRERNCDARGSVRLGGVCVRPFGREVVWEVGKVKKER